MKKLSHKYNKNLYFENNRKNINGLKPVRMAVESITKSYFKDRGFRETLFFNNWEIIVGEKYQFISMPDKITKGPNLIVRVIPSYAGNWRSRR